MKTVKIIAICALLLQSVVASRYHHLVLDTPDASDPEMAPVESTFNNRVDHFNLSSTETYSQRYWYMNDYWDEAKGPAILYIQGEAPGQIVGSRTMPVQLAKDLRARLFSLEHRFYGVSQPCKDWSLECLRLLNHHQAMADIANFIETMNRQMGTRKWVIVGGSYAGALVGWFRSKYPHLVTVAYSASGVINSIVDFKRYIHQVEIDMKRDPICHTAVTDLNAYAYSTLTMGSEKDKQQLKAAMNATMLADLDFYQYFTDIYVGEVQYSARKSVCQLIKTIGHDTNMLIRAAKYAEIGKTVGVTARDFTLEKEKNIQIDVHSSSRQWTYQVCSSLGWFQNGETNNPMRAPILNVEYWRGVCKRVFGTDLFPNEEYTNTMTGDLRILPTLNQTLFINGGSDPWQWAGVRDESLTSNSIFVKLVKCDDCGHCIDLYKPKETDPKELTEARILIRRQIMKWMGVSTATSYAD